jgi:hypothetical protein
MQAIWAGLELGPASFCAPDEGRARGAGLFGSPTREVGGTGAIVRPGERTQARIGLPVLVRVKFAEGDTYFSDNPFAKQHRNPGLCGLLPPISLVSQHAPDVAVLRAQDLKVVSLQLQLWMCLRALDVTDHDLGAISCRHSTGTASAIAIT